MVAISMDPHRNKSSTTRVRVMALSTRAWGMVLRRSTTWSLPRRPAHSEISSTPAVAVLMPPAVEPEDRRDGTYYLDRKVSYNRGV